MLLKRLGMVLTLVTALGAVSHIVASVPAAQAAGVDVPVVGGRIRGTRCIFVPNPTPTNHTFCPMTEFPPHVDLSGIDLSYAVLIGSDLTSANLTAAKFTNANLGSVTLQGAILQSSDLSKASLSAVRARGANFRNASLADVNLALADLTEADLTEANFASSQELLEAAEEDSEIDEALRKRFAYTTFDKAVLTGAVLSSTHLHMASFKEAVFADTDLRYATFVGLDLIQKRLVGADLSKACLPDARLSDPGNPDSHTIFSYTPDQGLSVGANLSNANLAGVIFSDFDLRAVNFAGAILVGANLDRANMQAADLTRADLSRSSLERTDVSSAKATEANFQNAVLARASLSESTISGANFDHATLTGARLVDVVFADTIDDPEEPGRVIPKSSGRQPTSFRFANLVGADLSSTSSTNGVGIPLGAIGVDFSHANMFQTNLTGTNMTWARLYAVDTSQLDPGANLAGATLTPNQAIAAGGCHSCVVTRSGSVYCWGNNTFGRLGNTPITGSAVPVPVIHGDGQPLRDVTSIAAGSEHTCALNTHGHVYCWGNNGYGRLGNNSTRHSGVPVQVVDATGQPLNNVLSIVAGESHSCALNMSNNVYCWGNNELGRLGNNHRANSAVPVKAVGPGGQPLRNITNVAIGGTHTCAVDTNGHVYCWGSNSFGQLGNNATEKSRVAIRVVDRGGEPLNNIISVAAGDFHSCALDTIGGVHCWGHNTSGQLRNASTTDCYIPSPVVNGTGQPISGITTITSGGGHTCAVQGNGSTFCWGNNLGGQLGDNSTQDSPVPVQVVGWDGQPLNRLTSITAGAYHSCAVQSTGHVSCWGNSAHGRLGNGSTPRTPNTLVQVVDPTAPQNPLNI